MHQGSVNIAKIHACEATKKGARLNREVAAREWHEEWTL
jgi:hypothetical protein